jgi:hypothetical protein
LTADGQVVAIARYGRSFNDSAVYKHQASAHLLLYNPPDFVYIRKDLLGVPFNWVVPTSFGGRDEYNVGLFYDYDFQSFRSWT